MSEIWLVKIWTHIAAQPREKLEKEDIILNYFKAQLLKNIIKPISMFLSVFRPAEKTLLALTDHQCV